MTKLPADAKVELVARALARNGYRFGDAKAVTQQWVDDNWCHFAEDAKVAIAALEQSDAEQGEDAKADELEGLVELLVNRVIEIANSIPPPDGTAAELMMAATTARSFLHHILAKHYAPQVDKR